MKELVFKQHTIIFTDKPREKGQSVSPSEPRNENIKICYEKESNKQKAQKHRHANPNKVKVEKYCRNTSKRYPLETWDVNTQDRADSALPSTNTLTHTPTCTQRGLHALSGQT